MTRINEDVGLVASSTVGWVPQVIIQGIQIVLSLIIIIYFDFSLLLVVIIAAPIFVFGSKLFLGKTLAANKNQRKISSQVMELYKDTLQNIQAIKAFDLNDYFGNRSQTSHAERREADLAVNKYSILSWSTMYVSGQIVGIICLAWAMYHVYQGRITIGTLTMMFMVASKLAGAFKSMVDIVPQMTKTVSAAERLQ